MRILLTGALVGAALAAAAPAMAQIYDPSYNQGPPTGYYYSGQGYDNGYGPGYGYDYGPRYTAPYSEPVYEGRSVEVAPAPNAGDDVAYCQQRFRSYDTASGTYLGYDGMRHPCP